jgi:hypothetical protein
MYLCHTVFSSSSNEKAIYYRFCASDYLHLPAESEFIRESIRGVGVPLDCMGHIYEL